MYASDLWRQKVKEQGHSGIQYMGVSTLTTEAYSNHVSLIQLKSF